MQTYVRDLILYSSMMMFIFLAGFTEADAKGQDRDFYYGISGGQTRVKNSTTQQYQAANSFGVKLGLRIYSNDSIWTGSEVRYTKTSSSQTVNVSGSPTPSTYEVETTGLYFTGHSRGRAYIKGKLGVANQATSIDGSLIQDTTRASYGAGVGFRTGGARLEVEYTQYGDNVAIVSAGYTIGY